ncbi:hypothetical protein [Xanthobacter agilis]|uniref:hypothetical protein n=1 Tax=Xanthobacter agilis TaxID=47492 RepID=UPI00372BF535
MPVKVRFVIFLRDDFTGRFLTRRQRGERQSGDRRTTRPEAFTGVRNAASPRRRVLEIGTAAIRSRPVPRAHLRARAFSAVYRACSIVAD